LSNPPPSSTDAAAPGVSFPLSILERILQSPELSSLSLPERLQWLDQFLARREAAALIIQSADSNINTNEHGMNH
jgi:hypothetical protein